MGLTVLCTPRAVVVVGLMSHHCMYRACLLQVQVRAGGSTSYHVAYRDICQPPSWTSKVGCSCPRASICVVLTCVHNVITN